MGVTFPDGGREGRSEEGPRAGEPDGDVVLRRPKLDELEMHRARAAASLLSIRLRDILREELGGTYGVSVGLRQLAAAQGLRHRW